MRSSIWIAMLISCSGALLRCSSSPSTLQAQNEPVPFGTVRIDLAQSTVATLKQGIVNGPNEYTGRTAIFDQANSLLSALKPTSWRFSGIHGFGYGGDVYRFIVEDYHFDTRFGTQTVLNLQDAFSAARGGGAIRVQTSCPANQRNCFTSFADLQQAWRVDGQAFLGAIAGTNIGYFDVFSEPDLNSFTNVTPDQLYELFKDSVVTVRQARPGAKIVAPSNAGFNATLYEELVSNVARDGIRLDAISWHELGTDPDVISGHVATMKSILQKYPAICQPTCPEIHINEYQGEDTVLIPGQAAGWLMNLELAGVNHATRSCWGGDPGSPIPYESCWYGFSGLLQADNVTPQPLYWVYKYYAELNGSRYALAGVPAKTALIAGALGSGKIGALVGNYGTTALALSVQLAHFSGSAAKIELFKLPNTANQVVAMPNVPLVRTLTVSANGAALLFPLDTIGVGEAYWAVITPIP